MWCTEIKEFNILNAFDMLWIAEVSVGKQVLLAVRQTLARSPSIRVQTE